MNTRMTRIVTTAVLLCAHLTLVPYDADATGCNSAASVVGSDIGMQMATFLAAAGYTAATGDWVSAYQNAKKWVKIADKSIQYFNKMAGSSWARIGPRPLVLGRVAEGRLVGTSGRIFITSTTLPTSSARITIVERGGKGKVGIAICRVNANGEATKLRDVTLNESKSEKKDKDEGFEYVVSGVKDCVLQVHLDGKSATNTFEYRIKVSPVL